MLRRLTLPSTHVSIISTIKHTSLNYMSSQVSQVNVPELFAMMSCSFSEGSQNLRGRRSVLLAVSVDLLNRTVPDDAFFSGISTSP